MTFSRATLNEWAAAQKLDLIGVADPDHYADVAPQWNPLSILPKAKSIVVFAREIPRSYFRGIEEGTLWMRVNRYLGPDDAYCLCRRFEDNGFLAVPCSPLAPQRWPDGVEFKAGKPAPNVTPDIRVAAQLAGLGEIGYNGTFLTSRFGPRQALGMLFCEAKLEPDEPFRFGTVCRREQCLACRTGCPAGALGPKRKSAGWGDRRRRSASSTRTRAGSASTAPIRTPPARARLPIAWPPPAPAPAWPVWKTAAWSKRTFKRRSGAVRPGAWGRLPDRMEDPSGPAPPGQDFQLQTPARDVILTPSERLPVPRLPRRRQLFGWLRSWASVTSKPGVAIR